MTSRPHDSTLVYSSNDFADSRGGARVRPRAAPAAAPAVKLDGIVRVWLERKGRNGKPVSIVRGLGLAQAALAELATRLKRTCGTGGTAKDGEIIIQGDHRARIARELEHDGHRVKLAGG
jgi:translation initiation factor 1